MTCLLLKIFLSGPNIIFGPVFGGRSEKILQEQELAQYRIKQGELDKVIRQVDKSLMETRATVFIWNKTHLKMSEGLTHPATISLFSITEKLMDTAIQEIPIDIPF